MDACQNRLQGDPASTALQTALASLSSYRLESTARLSTLRSWGVIRDTAMVWNAHYFSVIEPAQIAAVIDARVNSPAHKKGPKGLFDCDIRRRGDRCHPCRHRRLGEPALADPGDTATFS